MFIVKSLHTIHDQQSVTFKSGLLNNSITISVLLEFVGTVSDKYPALIAMEFYDVNNNIISEGSELAYSKEFGFYKYISSHGYNGIYDFTEVINVPNNTKTVVCKLIGLYCRELKIIDSLKVLSATEIKSNNINSVFYINNDFSKQNLQNNSLDRCDNQIKILTLGNTFDKNEWVSINLMRINSRLSLLFSRKNAASFLIITDDFCKNSNAISLEILLKILRKRAIKLVLWDFDNSDECVYANVASLVDSVFCTKYEKVSLYKNYNQKSYFLPEYVSSEKLINSHCIGKSELQSCTNMKELIDAAVNFRIPTMSDGQYERTLKVMFGDFIQNDRYILDDRRITQQLYRKILNEHCFVDRLNYIASKINTKPLFDNPIVVLLSMPKNKADLRQALENMKRQNYVKQIPYLLIQSQKLKLYAQSIIEEESYSCRIISNYNNLLKDFIDTTNVFVCYFDTNNYYGVHYIQDLVLGYKVSSHNIIVPTSYYNVNVENNVVIQNELVNLKFNIGFKIYAALIKITLFNKLFTKYIKKTYENFNLLSFAISSSSLIENIRNLPLITCRNLAEDFSGTFDCGISFSNVDEQNVNIKPRCLKKRELYLLSAKDLQKKFVKNTDLILFNVKNNVLNVNSKIDNETDYKYFYSKELIDIKVLEDINGAVVEYEGSGELKVYLVLVYLDEHGDKIKHNILDIDSYSRCYLPAKTSKIKIGLKFQGKGYKQIQEIKIVKNDLSMPLFNSRLLFISKYYASYTDLYRNGFIHQRLKEYKRLGLKFDFFEYCGNDTFLNYREFDGINVITGNLATLSKIINLSYIKNIGIHFPYPDLISMFTPYLNRMNLTCWFHGNEIDSWKDRIYEFINKNEDEIIKIKSIRDERQTFYKNFLPNSQRINFIFVSNYFKNRVLCNLAILPKNNFWVIHNFINPKLFVYKRRKNNELYKVLVIRPFSSLRYANDLIRDAILCLSKEKCFKKFKFDIYGDGPLFEICTKPLKKFKNVKLHRTFLLQSQIAELHRTHGLMLIPTRGDTQGVSRDEAMSSGLSVITTNVEAIPEFTDSESAIVVPKEDYIAIANELKKLASDNSSYLPMTENANKKTRKLCNFNETILKEYYLLTPYVKNNYKNINFSEIEVIVYCDVNPNIFDGSSIWLNSVSSILSRKYKTLVLVKNNLKELNVIKDVLNNDNLHLLEPKNFDLNDDLDNNQIVQILIHLESKCFNSIALVIRGYDIAYKLAVLQKYKGKMYSYFSAFYKTGDSLGFCIPYDRYDLILTLFTYSKKILFQTKFIAKEFISFFKAKLYYSILPPAVPDNLKNCLQNEFVKVDPQAINIGYAGKCYPNWGIEELIDWSESLIKKGYNIKIHLVISKYLNSAEFRKIIGSYISRHFVTLYTGKDRYEALSIMKSMDFVWCWRPQWFEFTTLEYSMKLIENLYCNNICLMQPTKVNIDLAGSKYKYFIKNFKNFKNLLKHYRKSDTEIDTGVDTESLKRFILSNIEII